MKLKYISFWDIVASPLMLLPIQIYLMWFCAVYISHPIEEVSNVAITGWAGWLLVAMYNIQYNYQNMKRTARFTWYEIRGQYRSAKVALKLRYTLGRK